MPSVGYFNKTCTFKRRSETKDDAGDQEMLFAAISATLTRFPCGYRPERGWERKEAGRNESAEMGVIRVHSCDATRGVTAGDIITLHDTHGDVDFSIKYIDNRDRRNRYLYFTVEAGTAVR